jgi:hypothetical protein
MFYGRSGGAISGLWRILDGKDASGLLSNSELRGGSPRLCRMRTDRLAPVNTHTGFMGSRKLSSFDDR